MSEALHKRHRTEHTHTATHIDAKTTHTHTHTHTMTRNRKSVLLCYDKASHSRDDNGSAGHGSSWSANLSGSRGSRVSTRDPLTRDQVNKIPRTGCFVAVMMFDFESTST